MMFLTDYSLDFKRKFPENTTDFREWINYWKEEI